MVEPLEFLAKLAALTPRPEINLLIYHGVLAPHARWRPQVVGYGRAAPKVAAGDLAEARRAPPPPRRNWSWAALMRRAFAVDVLAPARMRREHAVVDQQVDLGPGRQRGQLRQELEGLEHEVRRPIAPGPLQLDRHPPIRPEPQTGLDQRGAEQIPAEMLQPGPIVGGHPTSPRSRRARWEAQELYKAITEPDNGVPPWLQQNW